jgi:hypothetical protein
MPNGDILVEPEEIHNALTAHSASAYSTPDCHKDGIHHEQWDWRNGGTKEDFIERIKHHNIPEKYINIIWDAMKPVEKSEVVKEDLTEMFLTPPSFHEFCNTISAKNGKSAGGISGLTYQHMQAWPRSFKRKVYENLMAMWESKTCPDWWKWRLLCPIPKNPEDNTPAGQRPIVLVEVLRKIWVSLIIQRINKTWNKYDILHSSQHGFRSRKGTDTALLGLQSMFEQSASSDSPLFLSSWDISKAFDSLSKNALRYSWIRLGVPVEISDFLVSLDVEGHTIVRTPFAQKKWI